MSTESTKKLLAVRHLGLVPYSQAYEIQQRLHTQRVEETIPDTLLLLQHPHVITLGKRGTAEDLLLPRREYDERGIEIVETDRGGQVTYHGPGQLVGYIISHLYSHNRRLRWFVETLEEVISSVLRDGFDLSARGSDTEHGVWVDSGNEPPRKIAALGIAVKNRVTMHGFALNVEPDMSFFKTIIPCGIRDKGQTSLRMELERTGGIRENRPALMDQVTELVIREFCELYDYEAVESP
ncbi:lipoyl(octanoyl) transferase LipB [Spirochaeta lutea]|uniref:Octanoyltransferase n=1 Tax=Spirochaeta lutea TaxID=1480694 RepID=A0A098QW30_9SPIO|nr:lipoyl(octanoyl) transferase LipB [Spirochaeta lutea]KGE71884.1 hypothetical protein DC28_08670 [Spirochaeta lutea]